MDPASNKLFVLYAIIGCVRLGAGGEDTLAKYQVKAIFRQRRWEKRNRGYSNVKSSHQRHQQ
ncbi:hypothetical protein MFRU_014g02520 [Monilinia fructicola]|nr:hypothetical protein MFRU_014g02520 [Monilinia fructicola]